MPSVITASESASSIVIYPPRLDLGAPLSPEQLQQSLQATMACHRGGPVWLFAYGSLIWRPECSAVERVRGRVYGYHRGLYLWSHEHRGTPQLPGLVFGLDRGGSCSGFAYRLPEENLDAALNALWRREMPVPSYRPHWLTCRLEDGSQVQALGFVLERHLPSYAGICIGACVVRKIFTCCKSGTTGSRSLTCSCIKSSVICAVGKGVAGCCMKLYVKTSATSAPSRCMPAARLR